MRELLVLGMFALISLLVFLVYVALRTFKRKRVNDEMQREAEDLIENLRRNIAVMEQRQREDAEKRALRQQSVRHLKRQMH